MTDSFDANQARASGVQQSYFRVTDNIPEQTWYWLALGSIALSASLRLMGHANWSLFVGQWPPTFILFALYHRLIRPSTSSQRATDSE